MRSHVSPHHTGFVHRWIGDGFDLGPKIGFGGLVGHVDALTGRIEFPTVIDAAHARFFVASEEKRGTAMRAVCGQQANRAVGVAERNQVFAEQPHAHGIAVRVRQLRRQQGGHPVAPHDIAHRRPGANSGDQFVVFSFQHGYGRSPDVGLNIRLSEKRDLPPEGTPLGYRLVRRGRRRNEVAAIFRRRATFKRRCIAAPIENRAVLGRCPLANKGARVTWSDRSLGAH